MVRRKYKKPKRWFTTECTAAGEFIKLWFTIWKESKKPCSGHVYNCYKETNYNFRQIGRKSVNNERKRIFEEILMLHVKNSFGQLWNKVLKVGQSNEQGRNVINRHFT